MRFLNDDILAVDSFCFSMFIDKDYTFFNFNSGFVPK